MWIALRVPSARQRGTRKQVSPASVWASVRNASDIGAEQNHLWPISRYAAVAGRLRSRGVGAQVRAALLLGHRHADQGAALGRDRLRSRGRTRPSRILGAQASASAGASRSAGSAAKVIASGQQTPLSTWFSR